MIKSWFKKVSQVHEKRQNKNHASKNELIVSCIGTITPRKGQFHIVDALIKLDLFMQYETNLNYEKISLNLVGHVEESIHLPRLKHVQFNLLGPLSHSKCLSEMIKSDLICQPSSSEGMSNVVVEAIALNKPIIISDIPSNRYLVSSNTKSLLSKTNTTEHLLETLKCLFLGKLYLSSLVVDPNNIISLSERSNAIYKVLYK